MGNGEPSDDQHRLAAAALRAYLPGAEDVTGRPLDFAGAAWTLGMGQAEAAFQTLPPRILNAIAEDVPSFSLPARLLISCAIDDFVREGTWGDSEPCARDLGNAIAFTALACALNATVLVRFGLGARVGALLDAFEATTGAGRTRPCSDPAGSGYLDADPGLRDDAAAFVLCSLLDEIAGAALEDDLPPRTEAAIRAHIRDPRRIIDVIRERRTLDPDVIIPLLDAPTDALASGHL